jgi:hypothetical protein
VENSVEKGGCFSAVTRQLERFSELHHHRASPSTPTASRAKPRDYTVAKLLDRYAEVLPASALRARGNDSGLRKCVRVLLISAPKKEPGTPPIKSDRRDLNHESILIRDGAGQTSGRAAAGKLNTRELWSIVNHLRRLG